MVGHPLGAKLRVPGGGGRGISDPHPGVRQALAKFDKRLSAYTPFLASASLNTRTIVSNVFLLPLLYYLMQFYIAPWGAVHSHVQGRLHRATVAFNGGGFAYAHLVTARARGGPHVPLRDVWSTNLSMLAATYNVEESIGLQIPAMGEKTHRHWPLTQWRGRAMGKCMAYSAFRILEDHTVRKPGGAITLDDLPPRVQSTQPNAGSSSISVWSRASSKKLAAAKASRRRWTPRLGGSWQAQDQAATSRSRQPTLLGPCRRRCGTRSCA